MDSAIHLAEHCFPARCSPRLLESFSATSVSRSSFTPRPRVECVASPAKESSSPPSPSSVMLCDSLWPQHARVDARDPRAEASIYLPDTASRASLCASPNPAIVARHAAEHSSGVRPHTRPEEPSSHSSSVAHHRDHQQVLTTERPLSQHLAPRRRALQRHQHLGTRAPPHRL